MEETVAKHLFHRKIGSLINLEDFYNNSNLKILKDRACDRKGRQIHLGKKNAPRNARFCDVDILIATEKEAKVIIEIEESNVKPIHLFGKFFATACSECYYDYDNKEDQPLDFSDSVLFIQVLKTPGLKRASRKPLQWDLVDKSISAILSKHWERKWTYQLVFGADKEFENGTRKAKDLISNIQKFLDQPLRMN